MFLWKPTIRMPGNVQDVSLASESFSNANFFFMQHPELKATLRGHQGSVKSVQFRPGSQCELASAAREGNILLWDIRVHSSTAGAVQPTLAFEVRTFGLAGNVYYCVYFIHTHAHA
jgi:hypothetical protein